MIEFTKLLLTFYLLMQVIVSMYPSVTERLILWC